MHSKPNEFCPSCGSYRNRGVSIDAVIIKENNILLIKRGNDPFKGYWALPGGYVDWDETVEEAVAREVKEEVGLTVNSCKLINVYSRPDRHPNQVINVAYIVTASGEAAASDDATECRWFPLDKLPGQLAFDHATVISDAGVLRSS